MKPTYQAKSLVAVERAKSCKHNNTRISTVTKGELWPELKFPPLNLYNIWPTAAMCALHAEQQDASLWSKELND